jgi:hypothetical protein
MELIRCTPPLRFGPHLPHNRLWLQGVALCTLLEGCHTLEEARARLPEEDSLLDFTIPRWGTCTIYCEQVRRRGTSLAANGAEPEEVLGFGLVITNGEYEYCLCGPKELLHTHRVPSFITFELALLDAVWKEGQVIKDRYEEIYKAFAATHPDCPADQIHQLASKYMLVNWGFC